MQCLEINMTHLLLLPVQVLVPVVLHLVKQVKLVQALQKEVGPRMQLLEMLSRARVLASLGRRNLGIKRESRF